jgi:hypothetical protein
MGSNNLKLNEFRKFYLVMYRGLPDWASFLLLGLLVWIESKTINQRTKNSVDEAIKEYETLHLPQEVVVPPPVYSETGSDFFDEMRLTAPWVAQEGPSDPP